MLKIIRVEQKYIGFYSDQLGSIKYISEEPVSKDELSKSLFQAGADLRDIYSVFNEIDDALPSEIYWRIEQLCEEIKEKNPSMYNIIQNWLNQRTSTNNNKGNPP